VPEMLKNLFGEKAWYQSVTAWGLVVYAAATAGATAACESGLLSFQTCDSVETLGATLGSVLVVLGLRKAATAPDTKAPEA
jgi:hypothetical protein